MLGRNKFIGDKLGYNLWIAILSFFLLPIILVEFVSYEYLFGILLTILYIVIVVILGRKSSKIDKKIESYDSFLKTGKLIKNVPFYKHEIYYGREPERKPDTFFAVVDYRTKDGQIVTLGRAEEFSISDYGKRTTMDLYIDEDNVENYIIGFDLEEQIKNNELY